MKKNINKIIAFLFLISILLNIFPKLSVSQPTDIVYTFNENLLYSENSQESNLFNNSYNMRNKSIYTNFYNASFDFNNETVGSPPQEDGWSTDQAGGNIQVIQNLTNHNKVVEIEDDNNEARVILKNSFNVFQISGIVELWFNSNDVSDILSIFLREVNDNGVSIRIQSDKVQYFYSGGLHDATNGSVDNNQWYHIRFDFDTISDTYNFSLNGIVLDIDIPFDNTVDNIDNLIIQTGTSAQNYKYYIDAVGYSWSVISFDDLFNFDNDVVGNEPIGWISDNDVDCTTIIKDTLDGRTNILELFDVGGAGNEAKITKTLINPMKFSFQMDVGKSFAGGGNSFFKFMENDTEIVFLSLIDDDLKYFDGGFQLIKASVFTINIFIIIRITFDFNSDTMDVYVNNILEGSNLAFSNNGNTSIDQLIFSTGKTEISSFFTYIDNIYINPIIYQIGSNIFPFLDISQTIKEVDKYQFDLKTDDFTSLRDIGSSQFGNWNEIDTSNHVQIQEGFGVNNREIEFDNDGIIFPLGLEKEFNKITNIINLSFSFRLTIFPPTEAYNDSFQIFSINDDLVSDIEIRNGKILSNGATLQTGIVIHTQYIGNLYLNYNDNISIFTLSTNTSFIDSYFIPIQNLDNHSLGNIRFFSTPVDLAIKILYLDNIGVYIEGNSLNEEVGYLDTKVVDNLQWAIIVHNLITFNGNGSISFYAKAITKDTLFVLRTLTSYSGLITFNIFEKMWLVFPLPHLRLYSFNEVIINSIKISGVKANDGSIDRIPFYTHSGIDFEVNYFYVDTSNRLNFIHEADDTSVEFMTADFDFFSTSFNSNNRTVLYESTKINIALGFFIVNFSDTTSNILEIPSFRRTTSAILSQEKIVESFQIIITDNDIDSKIGITTGWISSITFGFGTNFNITVATLSLILMLVPLLIILLPTILIGGSLGKNFIIPMFLVMSLLTVITSLIPVWLFFIIVLSSMLFITKKRSEI